MKRISHILLAAVMFLSLALSVSAEQPSFTETEEVFWNIMESHLGRPDEKQLIQGALQLASKMAEEEKQMKLLYSSEDDTLHELERRLAEWQRKGGLDATTLNYWAINGMLESLDDPHSVFFTYDELRYFQSSVENEFVGFGFRLRLQDGAFIIREIVADSPAAASELQRGDRIIKVDDIKLEDKSFEEAYAYLKGAEGSEALLTVYRASESRELQVRLKRAMLTLPEAEGQLFANEPVGYIRLETFGSDGAYQVRDYLTAFARTGKPLKGLILDLRDNGGGYLSSARDIASLFMEEGLLMYTTNRNGVEVETWVRNGRDIGIPVRILVNGGSASASELLAGALRDHEVAKLVGTKTYGKGSAQQVMLLSEGDALKLTLNEYFTPKHTVVNHVGLEPDIVVEDDAAQVVEALQSLGVKSLQLSDQDGDTVINGIFFPTVHPLFKRENDGLNIRAAVLAHLIDEEITSEEEYIPLAPYLEANPSLKLEQSGNNLTLFYTMK
ncbi:S41 family peptidase [Brevibacillus invocatus]|uniref:S41 family peptidase n=1 Tax=Brevibacillus invocatus TaxID=173959 RepID=A0A3M8CMG5_9BACL|nr:S41 family peptidase [Brevibacillus invocatus]RNB76813.1 S41 family peptidase [Brevibacillus invocatus]